MVTQLVGRREHRIAHLPLHQWMHRYRMSRTLHFEFETVVEVMRSAFRLSCLVIGCFVIGGISCLFVCSILSWRCGSSQLIMFLRQSDMTSPHSSVLQNCLCNQYAWKKHYNEAVSNMAANWRSPRLVSSVVTFNNIAAWCVIHKFKMISSHIYQQPYHFHPNTLIDNKRHATTAVSRRCIHQGLGCRSRKQHSACSHSRWDSPQWMLSGSLNNNLSLSWAVCILVCILDDDPSADRLR